jgi:hypothetical protein
MPIIVRCDLCNAIITEESRTTLGVTEATTCIPDTEKHCAACTLQARLDDWPAQLQTLTGQFLSVRLEELKAFYAAKIREAFVAHAQAGAKAHFGSHYTAAVPTIQAEVLALRDTPMTITVTFGGGS